MAVGIAQVVECLLNMHKAPLLSYACIKVDVVAQVCNASKVEVVAKEPLPYTYKQ